ncbi:MAG TPA: hypothetical protein DCZ92_10775 [Elusimicrobia bacterium]|nr:MAG: hypothetical protein A2016_04465 [Elusimicrobia bacterium GWF2_62_30]HBA61278.1 hypothetical protein [Elusimicrobiota bacterium]
MLKIITVLVLQFFFVAAAFAQDFTLGSVRAAGIPAAHGVKPPAPPVTPPGVTIAVYTTDETFTFESEVKPALDARIAALKAAGLTTLGGRAVPAGNDYSFAIDYIPTVKNGAALPPAVIVDTYNNGAAYWPERAAEAAMKACVANFRAAKLAVLGSSLIDAGSDTSFSVDYLQKSLLRPTQEYAVKFETYTGGKFTFESEAVKNIPAYLALLKQAGVPALRGKAVKRADGDYAVQVEYVVKTNSFGPRPQYSVTRYDSREVFTFEKDAQAASQARLPAFAAAGVPPLSNFARKEGNDYSFGVDFLVVNIYQQGGVIPSAAVETYQAPETFTFDSEARKAMAEKAAAFNAAGLGVIGSAVTGSIGSYTYSVDYIAKAGANAPLR